MAVADRDEPSMTAISPKNSPLPSVTITVLLASFIFAISTLPSSTTNSSRPVEPSSKMTSSTSNSLMHFSMVMVATCLSGWSVHVNRETDRRKRNQQECRTAAWRARDRGGRHGGGPNWAGQVPKISVSPRPVTIWQAIKVTKWSTNSGESNVSDQQPQPTSGETGALGAAPAAPDTPAAVEPATAAAEVEAAKVAADQEATSPKPDAPKDAPKVDAVRMEEPKVEASNAEAPKVDAVKPEAPPFPGNVTIMSPGARIGADAKAEPAEGSSGKRRIGAMAAVVALATVAGALGGALATAGFGKLMAGDSAQA